ncbi:MAG TPA: patatin-like phospholipase family protein [Acetomicrobium sp.]|jgi:NTE family protein|uniref:patatin-like phospholipase family protein n=1 Tax=Acetomicrobium sp. TaxID=1872099 RepID=UPI002B25F0FD|nr:patatin-like phospholipase family protein [Acetomicrobium sp.]HOM98496.1 patatin-like phospholipase family protein [Acetomicrobium sp.]HPT64287.1 patatin-like phospholipase family protein [Acetomicrobium sp.]HXK98625.1 patatin-like phospholipase family protein [Acetomicrobium sp.]
MNSKNGSPTIGLTLGSGAARGWAHIGILRALADRNIHPDIVCGCSMGALVGGFYAALKLDELEEASYSLSKMGMLRMMGRLIFRGGFFDNKGIMQWIRDVLGDVKIEELPVKFGAVSVDLSTGMEIWMTSGDLVEAIMASISAPGMLMPFQKDGLLLGDGALANPVPVSLCRALGADIVIAVDLNGERVGRYFGPHWGLPKTNEANSLEEDGEKMPHFLEILAVSSQIIQTRLTRHRLAADPPDVLISPRVRNIRMLEFDKASVAIAEGRKAAERSMHTIEELLE